MYNDCGVPFRYFLVLVFLCRTQGALACLNHGMHVSRSALFKIEMEIGIHC